MNKSPDPLIRRVTCAIFGIWTLTLKVTHYSIFNRSLDVFTSVNSIDLETYLFLMENVYWRNHTLEKKVFKAYFADLQWKRFAITVQKQI